VDPCENKGCDEATTICQSRSGVARCFCKDGDAKLNDSGLKCLSSLKLDNKPESPIFLSTEAPVEKPTTKVVARPITTEDPGAIRDQKLGQAMKDCKAKCKTGIIAQIYKVCEMDVDAYKSCETNKFRKIGSIAAAGVIGLVIIIVLIVKICKGKKKSPTYDDYDMQFVHEPMIKQAGRGSHVNKKDYLKQYGGEFE